MHAAATRAFTRAMAVISACIIYPCWSIARRLMSQLYYALGVSVRDFMVLLRLWGVQGVGGRFKPVWKAKVRCEGTLLSDQRCE